MCPLGWQRTVGLKRKLFAGTVGEGSCSPMAEQGPLGLKIQTLSTAGDWALLARVSTQLPGSKAKQFWILKAVELFQFASVSLRSEPGLLWTVCLKGSLLFPLSFEAASGLLIIILEPEAVKHIMKAELRVAVRNTAAQSLRTGFHTRAWTIPPVCLHQHTPSNGSRLEASFNTP